MKSPWLDHYEPGTPADIEVPEHPITQDLIENAATYPHHTALIFGNVVEPLGNLLLDARMNYRDLLSEIYRFAAALQDLGIRKGDRVLIHLPNCPQFVIAYYSTLLIGAIAVPSNPEYVERELAYQVNDAGAETIITLSLTVPRVRHIRGRTPLRRLVVTNIKEYFPWPLKALFTLFKERKEGHFQDLSGDIGACWFQDLLRQSPSRPTLVVPEMDDTAVLMYTGGTTGRIKGAQLSHRNIQANAVQIRHWFPSMHEGEETILAALPFYHSYGMSTCLNLGIRTRSTLALIVDPRVTTHVLKAIHKHRPTVYPGVPAFYTNILNHADRDRYNLRSVKACISGAAPLPRHVQEQFQAITGARLVEGYGLSEAGPVTHANPVFGEGRIGTIGLPLPNTEAKIVDSEEGIHELPPGEPGELIVRGPQVMKGYWRPSPEMENVLRDGWLYTGDIAKMDEDGYFTLLDRKRDVIISSGGFKIYPREVEQVLLTHPKVKECAVVGVDAKPEKGERVRAFVVLKPGEVANEEEIRYHCRRRLTAYKVPRTVTFRATLPRTPFGKVMRRSLA